MLYFNARDGIDRSFADVTVRNLLTKEHSADLSVGLATLRGEHPPARSNRCTRAYYFVSGGATVTVADERIEAAAGDVVLVPVGAEHSLSGSASYVVVNSPAFDPDLE